MFSIIPVVDLKRGLVVRARAGDRQAYSPIVTPLSPAPDPAAVIEGLLRAWRPARQVYIADLDAIQGIGGHSEQVSAIAKRFPGIELWIDAGFASDQQIEDYRLPATARVVLGTESQRDDTLVRRLAHSAILSIDSRDGTLLGPRSLHENARLWPFTVIVMTLARVGMGAGPDLAQLGEVIRRAGGRTVVAAGGVRDWSDCKALQSIGVSGALVASALHDGRLRREHQEGEFKPPLHA
jgi:phosphoribosylformimino-5-aminoimidazole carboxamide ribotide isomerase